jgi:Replication initiation factor
MSVIETTSVFPDWLTALAPESGHNSFVRHLLKGETHVQAQAAYHRQHAVRFYPSGIRIYFSPDTPALPSIFVVDGEAFAHMDTQPIPDFRRKLVGILAKVSEHFTRLDLAVDIMDDGQVARDLADAVYRDKIEFGQRIPDIQKKGRSGEGVTTYIGRRTSPKCLRIYDKLAESKGDIPASRVEFELKANAAHAASQALSGYRGFEAVPRLFAALMNEFNYFQDFDTLEALRYGEVKVLDMPARESQWSKKQWLTRQVAPTFLKNWEGGGEDLWKWFSEMIEHESGSPKENPPPRAGAGGGARGGS